VKERRLYKIAFKSITRKNGLIFCIMCMMEGFNIFLTGQHCFGYILFFGVAKRPNLIALDMNTGEILKDFILILGASLPDRTQELKNRYFRNPGHSASGPNRIPLNKRGDYLGLFLGR